MIIIESQTLENCREATLPNLFHDLVVATWVLSFDLASFLHDFLDLFKWPQTIHLLLGLLQDQSKADVCMFQDGSLIELIVEHVCIRSL